MPKTEMGANPDVVLDTVNHIYYVRGYRRPGISEIIAGNELVNKSWFTDHSRDRGTAVHLACQLDDENDLDESTLDPLVLPYLTAWRKFKAETGFKRTIIEQQIYSETYGFCGTPDGAGPLNGEKVVIEIKSGLISFVTGLQLAAQEILLEEVNYPITKRFALQLKSDATYKLTQYTDPSDRDMFLHCLALYNLKVRQGLIKGE